VHRVQITQVMLNLIRNSLESLANDTSGTREIVVRSRRTETGECEISVCDNGPGVAPHILERLFDPFRSTKPNGTGLGLPMSRTIAQAHDGDVKYQSVDPRGACFALILPAAETAI
jgi:two-component system, LuxR family, sensor kinase FixL